MSRTLSFHLDEHGSSALATGLRRHGMDVTTTPEAGLLRAKDEQQLEYSTSAGRVLVTHDEDFLKIAATGAHHAGIAYCHQGKYSLGELIEVLVLLWELCEPGGMLDRVEYL